MSSSSIAKRPNGKWRARYRDDANKEHAKHFDRKIDAQRWLNEVTTSVVTGTYVDPSAGKVTFGKWFETWCARQAWEQSTAASAATVAATVTFSGVELGKLRASHVQAWVKSMTAAELAPSTIRLRFNYVRMAMIAAVGDRIVSRDETAGVKLPTAARKSTTNVRGDEIPSAEQVSKALEVAPDHFRGFVAVCALAGLRLGEAAGLRVEDVDFLGRVIRVRQQVQGTTKDNTRTVPPKYGSKRDVPVAPALVELLAHQLETVGSRKGFMFTSGVMEFNRSSAGAEWRKVREQVPGMEKFTLHSLRHFFASALISSGCDVVTVQRALGHSSPAITLNVYSHMWPDAEDKTRAAAVDLTTSVLGVPADRLRTEGQTS